jgi:hypothetical protein
MMVPTKLIGYSNGHLTTMIISGHWQRQHEALYAKQNFEGGIIDNTTANAHLIAEL